jgi:hypothetical protein
MIPNSSGPGVNYPESWGCFFLFLILQKMGVCEMHRTLCSFFFITGVMALTLGCGGGGNKDLKNDPKVSAKNEADYKLKMEEAMKSKKAPEKPKYGGK